MVIDDTQSPVYVTESFVVVREDVTLTINEGVTVYMCIDCSISVEGTLKLRGSSSEKIKITYKKKSTDYYESSWDSITLKDKGEHEISHVIFENSEYPLRISDVREIEIVDSIFIGFSTAIYVVCGEQNEIKIDRCSFNNGREEEEEEDNYYYRINRRGQVIDVEKRYSYINNSISTSSVSIMFKSSRFEKVRSFFHCRRPYNSKIDVELTVESSEFQEFGMSPLAITDTESVTVKNSKFIDCDFLLGRNDGLYDDTQTEMLSSKKVILHSNLFKCNYQTFWGYYNNRNEFEKFQFMQIQSEELELVDNDFISNFGTIELYNTKGRMDISRNVFYSNEGTFNEAEADTRGYFLKVNNEGGPTKITRNVFVENSYYTYNSTERNQKGDRYYRRNVESESEVTHQFSTLYIEQSEGDVIISNNTFNNPTLSLEIEVGNILNIELPVDLRWNYWGEECKSVSQVKSRILDFLDKGTLQRSFFEPFINRPVVGEDYLLRDEENIEECGWKSKAYERCKRYSYYDEDSKICNGHGTCDIFLEKCDCKEGWVSYDCSWKSDEDDLSEKLETIIEEYPITSVSVFSSFVVFCYFFFTYCNSILIVCGVSQCKKMRKEKEEWEKKPSWEKAPGYILTINESSEDGDEQNNDTELLLVENQNEIVEN